jgi:hypothetical protein
MLPSTSKMRNLPLPRGRAFERFNGAPNGVDLARQEVFRKAFSANSPITMSVSAGMTVTGTCVQPFSLDASRRRYPATSFPSGVIGIGWMNRLARSRASASSSLSSRRWRSPTLISAMARVSPLLAGARCVRSSI